LFIFSSNFQIPYLFRLTMEVDTHKTNDSEKDNKNESTGYTVKVTLPTEIFKDVFMEQLSSNIWESFCLEQTSMDMKLVKEGSEMDIRMIFKELKNPVQEFVKKSKKLKKKSLIKPLNIQNLNFNLKSDDPTEIKSARERTSKMISPRKNPGSLTVRVVKDKAKSEEKKSHKKSEEKKTNEKKI